MSSKLNNADDGDKKCATGSSRWCRLTVSGVRQQTRHLAAADQNDAWLCQINFAGIFIYLMSGSCKAQPKLTENQKPKTLLLTLHYPNSGNEQGCTVLKIRMWFALNVRRVANIQLLCSLALQNSTMQCKC